jgi:hypothetical protein
MTLSEGTAPVNASIAERIESGALSRYASAASTITADDIEVSKRTTPSPPSFTDRVDTSL